ncbi:MAG: NIF family HAD-type phosphatase [Ruminococcus sp.]
MLFMLKYIKKICTLIIFTERKKSYGQNIVDLLDKRKGK